MEEEKILQKTGHIKKQEKKAKVYRPTGIGKYIPTNISKRMNEDSIQAVSSTIETKKKNMVKIY